MKTRIFTAFLLLFTSITLLAQHRIIGGTAVNITERPFQVAIFIDGEFKGGGTIINNQWILTAAHIPIKYSVSQISISSGYAYLNNDTKRKSISQIIIHPKCDTTNKINDIALLKLTTPLIFDSSRKPINISNKKSSYPSGSIATVSGWGRDEYGNSWTSQLRKADVTIESCTLEEIKTKTSTSTSYHGDSGSPLTISAFGDIEVIGLVSHGSTQAPTQFPTYYTNVGSYRNWIASHVDLYSISGPELICTGSTEAFTISAPGATFELSPNLSIVYESGNNYTIKGNYNGRAYVNIIVGNTYLAKKAIWVGAPIISGITMNGQTLTAETLGGDASISRTEWKIGSNVFTSQSKSISAPYNSGTYYVSVRASNSCGTGDYYTTQINFQNNRAYSISVISGSKIVTVSPIKQENETTANVTTHSKLSSENIRYVLANLMSGQVAANGILPSSGGTLDFGNVTSGLYALKLYTTNGIEETFKISL